MEIMPRQNMRKVKSQLTASTTIMVARGPCQHSVKR